MKHHQFSFLALFALLLSFSLSTATSLETAPPPVIPDIIIDECVGECGTVAAASATALASGFHYFSASGSLCPNKAAYVIVQVNGSNVFQGLATPGTQQGFYASKNDHVYMLAYLVNGQSGVVCKRLGNLTLRVGKP